MSTFTVTAWHNGAPSPSGAGYGFKLAAHDRDRHFDRSWAGVVLELPGSPPVECNVGKPSFWNGTCRELVDAGIGRWLLRSGHAPWRKGTPPTFTVESLGGCRFRVQDREPG
jgi:hypothetical protein